MFDPRARHRQSGFVLIPVLLILGLLLGLGAALTVSVIMDAGQNGGYNRATAGFYAAEAGLNTAMNKFRDEFLNFQVPCSGTSSNCADFNLTSYSLGPYAGGGQRTVTYQLTDPGGNPTLSLVPAGHLFAGLNSVQYTYLVDAQSLNNSVTEADVGAEFDINNIPIFQFLAFYANDLEILPGQAATMHGRIHTNGDLYLNSDASLTVTTNASNPRVQITSKGSIYRGRKDTSTCTTSAPVQIAVTNPTPNPTPILQALNCIGSTTSVVPTSTLQTWNGSMISGVSSINVPLPAIMQPVSPAGQYWVSADLRIALYLNTTPAALGSSYPIQAGNHTIVALNADDTINQTLTQQLQSFINDYSFNQNYSQYPGTKPIFVSDVPGTPGPGCTCNLNNSPPTPCALQLNCYSGVPVATFTPVSPTPTFTNTPKAGTPTAIRTGTPTAHAVYTSTPTFGPNQAFYNLDRIYGTNTSQTLPTPNATPSPDLTSGSMFKDADDRRGGFYNWREKKWIYLLNVNLRDLLLWNLNKKASTGTYPFFDPTSADPNNTDPTHTAKGGPVIYLTVTTSAGPSSNPAVGVDNYGVRVFGSSPLPFPTPSTGDPTGITLVSDQAFYIAGNYNYPGTIGATSYPKQPAAIMGDSINVMSNNWMPTPNTTPGATPLPPYPNDYQSVQPLGANRSATTSPADTTYVYAAFIGGVDTTLSGQYNGGLENYPRFQEDWSSSTLNYLGSFVSLGTPAHVNGIWCGTGDSSPYYCNIYNPPTRQYDYDSDFNNVKNLPPMTPRFVYVQQIVFTENFK